MSATFYVPGTVYTVGSNPAIKLLNVRNTATFSEFIVRGANTGPLTPGKKVRLRNLPNVAGPQVFPYGYATGQPGLVPVPPTPPVDPCEPVFTGDVWPSNPPSACLPAMTALGDIVAVGHRTLGGTLVGHTSFYWTTVADGVYYGLVSVLSPSNDLLRGTGSLTLAGSYTNNTGADITNAVAGFINIVGGILLAAGESVKITINGRVCNNIVGPTATLQPVPIALPTITNGQTVAIKLVLEYTLLTYSGQGIPLGLLRL